MDMKIDLDPLEARVDERLDMEPVVEPYPGWARALIWGGCIVLSGICWWGLFLAARALFD